MRFMRLIVSFIILLSFYPPLPADAVDTKGSSQETLAFTEMQQDSSFDTSLFVEWEFNESAFIYDAYQSKHTVIPIDLTTDYSSSLTLSFNYLPSSTTRETIMYWDYYIEENGVLTYDSFSFINYSGSSITEHDIEFSVDYINQEFFYIRMGTLMDYDDNSLSGVTFKKIRNPYFEGTPSTTNNGTVIVSNESLNGEWSQSSGSFSISQLNEKMTIDESLPMESYRVDMLPEFNPSKVNASLIEKEDINTLQTYIVGATKTFWVLNVTYSSYYPIEAVLKHSGQYGEVWVHNNEISSAQAKEMGEEFDTDIYPLITENFAKESDVDRNKKVSILVFDIQDGYSGYGGYVGGYFSSRDLYQTAYSNQSEVFYIDTYPSMGYKGEYNVSEVYSTLAHEFQHMVNFNQNVLVEDGYAMDTWLNEALSMAAEHMYTNGALLNRIQYYERSSSIANGHSLLYWDRSGDTLSNYSLSYLFGQYLRIQAKQGESIYKELLTSPSNDISALEAIIQTYIVADKTLGEFLTDFRQALYVNDPTGLYGFNSEPVLSEINRVVYSGSLPRYLRGGGAINVPIEDVDTFSEPYNGAASMNYRLIEKESSDSTPPERPVVDPVTDQSIEVKGKAEPGSTVTIKAGLNVLGTGKAAADESFTVAIGKQVAGTILTVTATDIKGNESLEVQITVTQHGEITKRIAGSSRYSTAVAISQEGWNTAETVVLATGADFPDALAGGPLAYKENAPILLTRPTSLLTETEEEIRRLNAKKVIILGSKGAISLDVEDKLKAMGLLVERIGGKNRFDTAALIAQQLPSNQAVIAFAFNFPDVLSVSPYAAQNGIPILLTRTDTVPIETVSAMVGKTNTIVVGSTGAISEQVKTQFPQPVRYGGKTRFDTGKEIVSKLPMGGQQAYVATGRNFPDALAGSVLAAKNNAPILLVNQTSIPTATNDLLSNFESFAIFGSQGAVADEVKIELDRATKSK